MNSYTAISTKRIKSLKYILPKNLPIYLEKYHKIPLSFLSNLFQKSFDLKTLCPFTILFTIKTISGLV